jgi:hypothetical protein
MNYGFDQDNVYYVEYPTCRYKPGNMREETDRRADELGSMYSNIWISNSGGVDSQAMIVSFKNAQVPFEAAFMWHPGHNDNELNQVHEVDKKHNIKTHIIEINPEDYKEKILAEASEHNLHPNSLLQNIFVSKLPDDANVVSMNHDPYVLILDQPLRDDPNLRVFWYQGYYSPEIYRDRASKLLNRSGKVIAFGDTSEMLYSILNDDVFKACINSWEYFRDNGLTKPGTRLNTADRWDYYIKPLIYGKYWTRDELIFFTKNQGFKSIDWINVQGPGTLGTMAIAMNMDNFLKFLIDEPRQVKRFYQNVTNDKIISGSLWKKSEVFSYN